MGFIITENFSKNSTGVFYFAPNKGTFKEGKKCKGFGMIKYGEGSIYSGDIYYDGKDFNKLGQGKQDYQDMAFPMQLKGYNEHIAFFIGTYNYKKNDWIYGNGVLYFKDENNRPSHFVKGFFNELIKIREWEGEFDPNILANGYSLDMELSNFVLTQENFFGIAIKERINKRKKKDVNCLLLGDSYFDFMNDDNYTGNKYNDYFDSDDVNIAIGGTKFINWIENMDFTPFNPQKVIVNLGFNDIHYFNDADKVIKDMETFVELLHVAYPNSKIYLTTIWHCPKEKKSYSKEKKYNEYILNNANKLQIEVIDVSSKTIKWDKSFYNKDLIHPSFSGYKILYEELSKVKASCH